MTEQGALSGRRRESLIDAIDRLVDVGTVISGDAIIRLAGVDLIHLDLRLLLAAVIGPPAPAEPAGPEAPASGGTPAPGAGPAHAPRPALPVASYSGPAGAAPPAGAQASAPGGERSEPRLDQGLGQLVVAVVELVRQLLERQAVRRMRAGTLDSEQLERLGSALQALEQRMVELREALDVTPSELDSAIDSVEKLLDSSSTELEDVEERHRRVS